MDKNPQYYEGILQLRNPNEEVFRMIKNQFKNRKDVWIAKELEQKNGVDLYISSNRYLMALGKKLKKSFKGELIISKRLFSRNRMTSKDVYRGTVLFKLD